MKSVKNIKQLIKKFHVTTSAKMDQKVREDVLEVIRKSKQKQSALTQPKPIFGRFIVKSLKTKPAIAATILVLTGAVILSLWHDAGSGVALAESLTKIEQITAYMYKMNITKTMQSQSPTGTKSMSTTLISQDHGMTTTIETLDPNNKSTHQEIFILPQKKTMVIVEHQKKSYQRYKLNDTLTKHFKEEYSDPHTMIKEMLRCEYTSLGQSVIDGVNVEGFQTTDPAHPMNKVYGPTADVKVWVDAETRLPVRSEIFIAAEADGGVREHRVLDNFQWNVPVNAAKFEPNIPDDYTTRGDITIPAYTEETAIKGFTVFADLAGEYPDTLGDKGGKTFMKELEALLGPMRDRKPNEKYTKLADITMPIAGLVNFYKTLVEGKKDAAYYGEFVTPKDANLVLMRWKVSDNKYRVIFGDCHTETVTAEVLKELEKELPNNDKNY